MQEPKQDDNCQDIKPFYIKSLENNKDENIEEGIQIRN